MGGGFGGFGPLAGGAGTGRGFGAKKTRTTAVRIPIYWSPGLARFETTTGDAATRARPLDDPRVLLTEEENTHDQPFVVYLTGSSSAAKRAQAILDGAFLDERVAALAQTFCMIRGPGEEIDERHPFHRHIPGAKLPRLAVFCGDGTKVGQIDGAATANDVYALMARSFRLSYGGDPRRLVKDYLKLLTEMEKLRAARRRLDDRYLTAKTRAEEKRLDRKIAALEREAERLRARRERLLALKRLWRM